MANFFFNFITLALVLASTATAFPTYASLAGLSREEMDRIIPTLQFRQPENPPPPLKFNGTKLVNDDKHPWKPLEKGDIRGPCPGLNTLASHGVRVRDIVFRLIGLNRPLQYLPRNGIATPVQIIDAVQEGKTS